MGKTKKLFPKLKKKIGDFLTDESGKISKKDALGLSAGAMLLGAIGEVNAETDVEFTPRGHANADIGGGALVNIAVSPSSSRAYCYLASPDGSSDSITFSNNQSDSMRSHASGIVNGHYSGSIYVSGGITSEAPTLYGHGSHGSHGSHCSGKFCN